MGGVAMDMISSNAAGAAVAALFRCPDKYLGRTVGLTGDKKTIPEYTNILNKHLAPMKFKATDVSQCLLRIQNFTFYYILHRFDIAFGYCLNNILIIKTVVSSYTM